MMNVASVCLFGLFAAILVAVTAPLAPKYRGLILMGAGCVLLLVFLREVLPILNVFRDMAERAELESILTPLLKGLGITLLSGFCASFCRDLGEESLAGRVELCGKASLLTLSLPLLERILALMEEVL
ncbi:MAG: hypothetical protein IKC69_02505 [Clostridia bacterium]|nr:hypothetical protein [Clostridia bacterium]